MKWQYPKLLQIVLVFQEEVKQNVFCLQILYIIYTYMAISYIK